MKNLISLASKFIGAVVLALAGNAASATCTNSNGQPTTCPPPVYNPVPSTPPTTGTTNNGGNAASQAAAAAQAQAAANAAAIANQATNVNTTVGVTSSNQLTGTVSGQNTLQNSGNSSIKDSGNSSSTSGVTTGNIGSTSGVSTGAIGSNSAASTGASTATTGAVTVDGSNANNSSYSNTTTYKAAAAGATAVATGTMASSICSQSDGGWAIGGQALLWGASVSRNSGTSYKTEDVTFTNEDGTTRVEKRNVCTSDMAALKLMDAAQSPNATKGEKKVAYAIGMEMSPVVDSAVRKVQSNSKLLSGLFDDEARNDNQAAAAVPSTTIYQNINIDKTGGVTTTFNCKNGTKLLVDPKGVPVLDNKGGFICQPG